MARLFISYRRKDDGVIQLRDILMKKYHYAVWFDTENILLGDPDWQASIERGIENSDAVILCISPRCLEFDPIRYEMRTAQSKNKEIFIAMVQPFPNGFPTADDLTRMNLNSRHQVMDFTQPDTWEAQVERLVRDLYLKGSRPSPHDIRQNMKTHQDEQGYLRKLIDQVGTVNLRDVNPDYDGSDLLVENLYTPVQTDLRLVYSIDRYDIDQWWLCRRDLYPEPGIFDRRLKKAERDILDEANEAFRGNWSPHLIDILVEQRREQLYTEKQESHRRRMARLDRAYEVVAVDPVQVAVMGQQTLFIGEAGSGKTAFFHYLSACLAGHLLPNYHRPLYHDTLNYWIYGDITPVYIDMHLLWQTDYIEQYQWKADAVEKYIEQHLLQGNAAYWKTLQQDLRDGYGLLIFDGLERVLRVVKGKLEKQQDHLNKLLQSISDRYGKSRVLMSGRPEYFLHWQPDLTAVAHLTGLAPTHRVRLAEQIYSNRRAKTTKDTPQELGLFLSQFSAELRRNPRFVTMLSTVYPAKRGVLYRQTIDLLLDNWTKPSPGMPGIIKDIFRDAEMSVDEAEAMIIDMLGRVVAKISEQFKDGVPMGAELRNLMLQHLGDMVNNIGIDYKDLHIYLNENVGVLVGRDDTFRFAHDDFRHYFLAEHLLKQIEESTAPGAISPARQLIESRPKVWSKPIEMMSDMLVNEDHGSVHRIWDLIQDLLGEHKPGDPEAPDISIHANAVIIAARIAVAQQVLTTGRMRAGEQAIIALLLDWLVVLLHHADDLEQRAEVGRLLGALGDPRPGTGMPLAWVDIPAGSVWVGGCGSGDPYGSDDNSERNLIELPAFQISRYPVTVAQYEAFVTDGGYQYRAYWMDGSDDSGWKWAQNRQHPTIGWDDPQWHISNHPVIGVTWYEASAFCRWLSATTGTSIRLPSLAQWVRAARGDSERVFPYGSTFDAAAGNTFLSGIGRTTAVGLFAPPDNTADLSGNVYEWCRDTAQNDLLNEKGVPHYFLMGGSWNSYPGFCRVDARYKDHPAFATTYWGFRVVRDA